VTAELTAGVRGRDQAGHQQLLAEFGRALYALVVAAAGDQGDRA
jgi:hypothetical protein